jgi:hypothetical protein
MSNSTPSYSRTQGINQRVPAAPVSEWKIRSVAELPDHLQLQCEILPPYLTTKRAAEINGGGRSRLYEDAAAGYICAVKSGGSTLWETASILIRLANLPPAAIAAISPAPAPSWQHVSRRRHKYPDIDATGYALAHITAAPAPTRVRSRKVKGSPPASPASIATEEATPGT